MTKSRQHRAFFFLWIFIFPLLYQTVHRIGHHYSKEIDNCCNVNAQENTSCSFSHYNPNEIISKNIHCVICEYNFYIKTFVERYTPYFNVTEKHFCYIEIAWVLHKPKMLSCKVPRAPPVEKS